LKAKLILSLAVLGLTSVSAFAATGTANATATVITPITITKPPTFASASSLPRPAARL